MMTKGITVNRIPVFILISLMSLFLLVGCGGSSSDASTEKTAEAPAQSGSDEEIIRADVEGLINEHRPNIDSYVAILEKDEELMEIFELAHITPSDYAEAMLRHMDMGVDSVTVEGEAATATIQIKTPDFEKMDEMSDAKLDEFSSSNDLASMEKSDLYSAMGEILMSVASSPDAPEKVSSLDVDYSKASGEWVMEHRDQVSAALKDAFGGE